MMGILGGTFDPIHYGHLRPAQETMRALGLAELRLIPSHQPPHRAAPVAAPAERLQMVRLACAEFSGFTVDDRELRRPGPSYAADTLDSLRTEIGDRPLCYLMGADAFRYFESWHEWERIPDLAHLVVMQRPGTTLPSSSLPEWARLRLTEQRSDLERAPAGRLWIQSVTPQEISATQVRAAVARHESVQSCLPAAVWEFIRDQHVYLNAQN